ncbi:MAG: hypothetical protein WBG71_10385 [Leeuwenhoekiella sp.]
MKQLITVLTVLIALTGCSPQDPISNDTPEALGRTIIRAFQNDDKELFQRFVYTRNEVDHILENDTKGIKDPEREISRFEEYRPQLIEAFERIKSDADQKGLTSWEDVQFSQVRYKEKSKDLIAYNCQIEFTNGEFVGTIGLQTIYRSDNGWFMVGLPQFGRYVRRP